MPQNRNLFFPMARKREFDEQQFLEKATQMFWDKGFNAVSTAHLIEAFGISRSSLYALHKDKKSLFIQCLQHYRDTSARGLINILNGPQPVKAKISQILELLVSESLNDEQHKGCFMINTAIELAPHDADIREIVQQNRAAIVAAMAKAIQQGIDNQEISPTHQAESLANYFYNLIEGFRVDAKIQREPQTYERVIEVALSVLDT